MTLIVGELCNREVVIAREGDSVEMAAERMRSFHVGDLVVVEEHAGRNVPVGIVTDRDLVVGGLAQGLARLATLRVGDVMSRELVTARPEEDLGIALDRMRSHGVRRLPVVNREGGLEGILTLDDVLELMSEELAELAKLVVRQQKLERERRV
jgi:CBS-domain-containing membrane protein